MAACNSFRAFESVSISYIFEAKSHSFAVPCVIAVQYTNERKLVGILIKLRSKKK